MLYLAVKTEVVRKSLAIRYVGSTPTTGTTSYYIKEMT